MSSNVARDACISRLYVSAILFYIMVRLKRTLFYRCRSLCLSQPTQFYVCKTWLTICFTVGYNIIDTSLRNRITNTVTALRNMSVDMFFRERPGLSLSERYGFNPGYNCSFTHSCAPATFQRDIGLT
jgi:hypothetical protein